VKALSIGSDEFFDFDESTVDLVHIDGARPGSGQAHSWDELDSRPFTSPSSRRAAFDPIPSRTS
jgi:hypothetical protein